MRDFRLFINNCYYNFILLNDIFKIQQNKTECGFYTNIISIVSVKGYTVNMIKLKKRSYYIAVNSCFCLNLNIPKNNILH